MEQVILRQLVLLKEIMVEQETVLDHLANLLEEEEVELGVQVLHRHKMLEDQEEVVLEIVFQDHLLLMQVEVEEEMVVQDQLVLEDQEVVVEDK